MRLLNTEALCSHGNVHGRRDMVEILEAGLRAADPYYNAKRLIRVQDGNLIVGGADFEPKGSPRSGDELFDLSDVGNIYVIGAAKGVQRVARAIEELLGDRLTGGHVIDKYGSPIILDKIGVTLGAHPVPDENCILGSKRILEICKGLRKEDLVFTIAGNGISALLTLPVPGVSLEQVRRTTYVMQIERGAPTRDLNPIRNHLDLLKGGRISSYLQPATAIHLVTIDPNGSGGSFVGYDYFMRLNFWLHTLPDCSTFQDAVSMLKKWEAWDSVPASVREHLQRADPALETVNAEQFERWRFRIFGLVPRWLGMVPLAQRKAEELGYSTITLSTWLEAEAGYAGQFVASIAKSIEKDGLPMEPPCALFTTGEMLVSVGAETGIGGRNQEYALSAAVAIAGSKDIVMGAVDSDGTDGPGAQFSKGEDLPTLAGGIVDGFTVGEAATAGLDLRAELRRHNTSPALQKLDCGILAEPSISVGDLGVTLITGRNQRTGGKVL